ncbi:CdaR family protein [Clostridium tarantellae]|uniref:YbbR-like domain-containing protein n=1 Tax=Clostridium tarantellae TaxID=39493 RepID=A0A6I1MSX3_9CLOT|nr:CdaR family protein [Clostridium tarantellae]MPQ43329.1 hypothetical protein [Clostridium tarantellae]
MDKKNKNQTLIVKLICLALSFGLWMYILNVENPVKEYKVENVPVEIINQDALKEYNLALVPNQKLSVNLNLEGPASEVYRVKPDDFKVVVNLASYALRKGENNIPVEILTCPSNINIKKDSFLRVNIVLDDYSEKTLPIESKVKILTVQGIYIDKVIINPTTATISGAQEQLDKVKKLMVDGKIENVEKDMDIALPIKAVDENGDVIKDIKISPTTAKLSLTVKKGKQVPVNVITKGEPGEGLAIKSIIPDINKVELLGDEEILNKINQVDTEPIDLSTLADNSEVTAVLKIPSDTTVASGINQVKVKIAFSNKNINNNTPSQPAVIPNITKEVNLPINLKNVPKEYEAKLEGEKVKVKLSGLESDINEIKLEQIVCSVDLSGMSEGEHITKINITNPYNNIKVEEINPNEVKIKLIKKTNQ